MQILTPRGPGRGPDVNPPHWLVEVHPRNRTPEPGPAAGPFLWAEGGCTLGLRGASLLCCSAEGPGPARNHFTINSAQAGRPDKITMRGESWPQEPGGPAQKPQPPGQGQGRAEACRSLPLQPQPGGSGGLLSPLVGRGSPLALSCSSGLGCREEGVAAEEVTPAPLPHVPEAQLFGQEGQLAARTSTRQPLNVISTMTSSVTKTRFRAVTKGASPKSNLKQGLN